MLLESLARRGAETPRGMLLRLGVGTGALGGFTTFSSLALEAERLLAGGAAGQALAYVGISLGCGFLACLAGTVLAPRVRRA
jgi:CrcB protein